MYVLDELLLYCIFIHITFIAMLICWAVLEIELRTSHLLGTVYQALEPFYQFFLLFFFFLIGSHFIPGLAQEHNPICASPSIHHHIQPLVEMGSCQLFAWAALKPQSS
jgi:hypothetical protein